MNQCQGCMAGWPIKDHNPWPKGSQPIKFHEVNGGYKGELVVCTAYQYDKESKPSNIIATYKAMLKSQGGE